MYGGTLDTIGDILSQFGITDDTMIASGRAMESPTKENIQAVETAFENAGQSAPPELMELLWSRYYDAIGSNPLTMAQTVSEYLPYIIGGGIGLVLLFGLRRRGRK